MQHSLSPSKPVTARAWQLTKQGHGAAARTRRTPWRQARRGRAGPLPPGRCAVAVTETQTQSCLRAPLSPQVWTTVPTEAGARFLCHCQGSAAEKLLVPSKFELAGGKLLSCSLEKGKREKSHWFQQPLCLWHSFPASLLTSTSRCNC